MENDFAPRVFTRSLERVDEAMEEGDPAQRREASRALVDAPVRAYENRNSWQGAGILPSERKLQERAARFGVSNPQVKRLTEENLEILYDSCQIPDVQRTDKETDDPPKAGRFRLNVLHLRGTDELSTAEIFEYFSSYGPRRVEWINDTSCNVVWENRYGAARALANISVGLVSESAKFAPVINKLEEEMDCEDGEINEPAVLTLPNEKLIHPSEVAIAVPPGFVWRLGPPCPKANVIIIRFATVEDRKRPWAEKRSDFYKKYGNPNFDGMTGLISDSRKRRIQEEKSMRRHSKPQFSKENPWGGLSSSWLDDWTTGRTPPAPPPSTHSSKSSIGGRDADSDLNLPLSSDADDSDGVEWESRNKKPRLRMYADELEKRAKEKEEEFVESSASSASQVDAEEPRPRSRRLRHRNDMKHLMVDLRQRLSRTDESNGLLRMDKIVRVTIQNPELRDRDDEEYDAESDTEPVVRRTATARRRSTDLRSLP
ncbi:unnamed protein product [Notodromas monacha]|uniref:Nuclear cap-binding protein subunit 3 n=1 Tax=Notodromas monacha TaxID=399045 RepID=A0A7R9BU79_9CRUS|nr:unnamed protein product [Notodromas monacha]CAG0920220.1 unnamed protein product [Notodromas monacha]